METIFIDGKWEKSKEKRPSINPINRSIVNYYYQASEKQTQKAVYSAKQAFNIWSNLKIEKRIKIIKSVAELLRKEFGKNYKDSKLKQLIHKEVGKPINEVNIEIIESSDIIEYFVKTALDSLSPKYLNLNKELWPTKESIVIHEPLGVVAIIKPWNYPLELPIWSIVPALLSGNTVVFKPSENSPLIGKLIVDIFNKAGLPKGVLNMVTGDGKVGQYLVQQNEIEMVSFTGSQKTGEIISKICAQNNTKTSLELGGKDSMIILDDADLELTSNGAIWGSFTNCGQVCVGIEKIYIPERLYPDFLKLLKEKIKNLRPIDDVGPLVSEKQFNRFQELINDAISKGAELLVEKYYWPKNILNQGYFVCPNFLLNVNEKMDIYNEEIFGPVATIHQYDNIEEVIEQVNSAHYDLGASIWTKNKDKGFNLARKLKVGMVWINDVNVAFPEAPWCGVRFSGTGVELSEYSFLEYTRLKHINTEKSDNQNREWWFPYE